MDDTIATLDDVLLNLSSDEEDGDSMRKTASPGMCIYMSILQDGRLGE